MGRKEAVGALRGDFERSTRAGQVAEMLLEATEREPIGILASAVAMSFQQRQGLSGTTGAKRRCRLASDLRTSQTPGETRSTAGLSSSTRRRQRPVRILEEAHRAKDVVIALHVIHEARALGCRSGDQAGNETAAAETAASTGARTDRCAT